MTEFMNFIIRLFGENGYNAIPQPDQDKPLVFKNDTFEDYWIIAEGLKAFQKQADLFEWFTSDIINRFPLSEKNTSLLLLIDKDKQQGNFDEVGIENDALFFKKYVLPYTEGDFKELKAKIKNSEDGTFESLIMKDDSFEAVGKGEGYATLLYTIVHKLPFIPIQVERQQVEEHNFTFKNLKIANLFDSLNDFPVDINSEEARKFINNYLNADNNEEN